VAPALLSLSYHSYPNIEIIPHLIIENVKGQFLVSYEGLLFIESEILGSGSIFVCRGHFLSMEQNYWRLLGWCGIPDQPSVVLIILTVRHFVPSQVLEYYDGNL